MSVVAASAVVFPTVFLVQFHKYRKESAQKKIKLSIQTERGCDKSGEKVKSWRSQPFLWVFHKSIEKYRKRMRSEITLTPSRLVLGLLFLCIVEYLPLNSSYPGSSSFFADGNASNCTLVSPIPVRPSRRSLPAAAVSCTRSSSWYPQTLPLPGCSAGPWTSVLPLFLKPHPLVFGISPVVDWFSRCGLSSMSCIDFAASSPHSADSDSESLSLEPRSSCPQWLSLLQSHIPADRPGLLSHSVSYEVTETGSFLSLSLSSFDTPDISGLPGFDGAAHRRNSHSSHILHPSRPFFRKRTKRINN